MKFHIWFGTACAWLYQWPDHLFEGLKFAVCTRAGKSSKALHGEAKSTDDFTLGVGRRQVRF